MTEETWDVVIAGGGPAGLSAALMLGRSRRRVLVIDGGSPRNRFAAHMHGVLGMEGIAPTDLKQRGREEVAGYGVEFADGAIERVEQGPSGLRVTDDRGRVRLARTLVAATGLTDVLPDMPGLVERWGSTVLHCPYCHGWEVRDQRLGVLATSPFSLHVAELVRQLSDRVTVFTAGLAQLGDEAEQRLRSRGVQLEPAPVAEILGAGDRINAARLIDGREIPLDALFVGGLFRPHDDYLAPLKLARNDLPFGSFTAVDGTGRTSNEHVWAIGNLVNPMATVPMSIGAGAHTGAAVNAALAGWDFDAAVAAAA
ncbi:NAD(P)/FAD-dependent oxidoreductase [Enemella sp. A6]|uniref:NAD(P)/FAD-dependent oxidoreductase n=1 Tax=Enemella sp. A6 TaxID=3440152 RepID=UPI003EBFCD96